MKKVFYLFATLILLSFSNRETNLEGKFVRVLTKNKEYNVYTFDFNNTLSISNNGNYYLITDNNGNKSIATEEKGIISYNNCKILVDNKENVLTKICSKGNNSYSSDYWSLEKIDNYLSNLQNISFKDFINTYLNELPDFYGVPDIDALNDKDKTYIDNLVLEKNPYYPFITIGDFNKDNKYPDIAVIGGYKRNFIYDTDYNNKSLASLFFLHAGSEKLIEYNFKNIYPFIRESVPLEKTGKNNSVLILNIKDWSGWNVEWNGRKYTNTYVNLH